MRILIFLVALFLATPAFAGKANVIDVKVTVESESTFSFDVTIRSDDTGWEKYANRFEVLSPDGKVLGTRVLAHPHETEQPFTRELSGVTVPAGITEVLVRAHDSVEGYGGAEMKVRIQR
jgi:hypothetical protein